MFVSKGEQQAPLVQGHDPTGRIAGCAHKKQLGPIPNLGCDGRPVARKSLLGGLGHEVRQRTCQKGSPFIDLIEGVGHHNERRQRRVTGIDHRLGECEECLTGSIDGEHLTLGVEALKPVTLADPIGNGLPQCGRTDGCGVGRQTIQPEHKGVANAGGCCMLRFANRKINRGPTSGRIDTRRQSLQAFEGVGLKRPQTGVHPLEAASG